MTTELKKIFKKKTNKENENKNEWKLRRRSRKKPNFLNRLQLQEQITMMFFRTKTRFLNITFH